MRLFTGIVTPALALLVAGCATPSIPNGATKAETEAALGKPADVLNAPGGEVVWQYPRGPGGQTTYIVTFGADGRVRGFI